MSLTNFPNGITSFGVPVVGGAGGYASFWTGRVWFVDGTDGSDGNSGLHPEKAYETLQAAVTAASKDDTIFIRPQAVGVRYTENITVPVTTHAGLNIIGTGNGKGNSVYQACSFKGVGGLDSPVITLNSSYANVENIHFWTVPAQTHGAGLLLRWNTPVGLALNIGSSVVNCSFSQDLDDPAGAGVVQSSIRMDSTEGQLVEGCFFQDCRVGISVGSTQSAAYRIVVKDNLFKGVASNIAANLMLADISGMEIVGNSFGHAVPSHAAGTMTKYIFVIGGATVTGGVAGNYQGAAAVAFGTNNTASSLIAAGNFGLGGPWTS
jgi:hypothetical protein